MSDLATKILSAANFKRKDEPVSVPQWPGTEGKLFVRNFNAHETEQYRRIVSGEQRIPGVALAAQVAAFVLVDEHGSLLFTSDAELRKLSEGDPDPLETVLDKLGEIRNRSRATTAAIASE